MNRIAMLLLVGAALFVGACGGSDESTQTAASGPAPASKTPTATPTSTDWPDADAKTKKSKDSGGAKAEPSSGGGASKTVAIENFAFGPSNLTVKVGDKITWTNDDDAPHTVTGGELDSSNLSKGGTFSFTADKAGTISYICAIHPTMKGSITVQ